jgi:transcriptional regulator with XRE-family HTH domain
MNGIDYFAINLSHLRTSKGLTQSELASRAGTPFTQSLISNYERGLHPSEDHVRRIAAVLDVPAEAILRRPRVIRQHDALQAVMVARVDPHERQVADHFADDVVRHGENGGAK